jgi:hypothetical protein
VLALIPTAITIYGSNLAGGKMSGRRLSIRVMLDLTLRIASAVGQSENNELGGFWRDRDLQTERPAVKRLKMERTHPIPEA